MVLPAFTFLLFALLATTGAAWIALAHRGRRAALATAAGFIVFFLLLAAFVYWVLSFV